MRCHHLSYRDKRLACAVTRKLAIQSLRSNMSDCIILSAVSEAENDTYVAKYAELVEIKLLRIEKKNHSAESQVTDIFTWSKFSHRMLYI